jgi:hypothetical protein
MRLRRKAVAAILLTLGACGCAPSDEEETGEAEGASTRTTDATFDLPVEKLQWATLRAKTKIPVPAGAGSIKLGPVDNAQCEIVFRAKSGVDRWIDPSDSVKISNVAPEKFLIMKIADAQLKLVDDLGGGQLPTADHYINCDLLDRRNGSSKRTLKLGDVRKVLELTYNVALYL